jgi:hypothetical protein
MSSAPQPRTKVFISYSHRDVAFRERLETHLTPLERTGTIERWDDTRLRTGQRWQSEIEQALASARIAILLVSPDFLASSFIQNEELPKLLAAEQERGLVIMSVILKPCRFGNTALAQFQALNPPEQYLAKLPEHEQDAYWLKLTEEIESIPLPP